LRRVRREDVESGLIVMENPRITARSLLHRGKKFDFELLTVQRPSGSTLKRENVRHPGAIVIVPILLGTPTLRAGSVESAALHEDPVRTTGVPKSIVLIRNFRISLAQPLLECCAGTIERPRLPDRDGQPQGFGPGEPPELCAARELIEETGYQAATLIPLGWFYTTPGLTDEQMFAFAATGLTYVGQKLEEDETIEVEIIPAARALDMIRTGELRDAKSILAILLAERAGLLV
jgi:ADP-ribose pyrophosphatase